MSKALKIFLLLVFLNYLVSMDCIAHGNNSPATVVMSGQKLSPRVKYIEQKKVLYINHALLEEIFKIKIAWENGKDLIKINSGHIQIEFQTEHSRLKINGAKYELSSPLLEKEANLWFPLEFFQILGIAESGRKDHQLRLEWKENYLLNLDLIEYQGLPAIELLLSGAIEYKDFQLTEPDRLVCQFPTTKIHPLAFSKLSRIRNGLIKKVRYGYDDTRLLTLVFDLIGLPGYRIVPAPDSPKRVLLVFDYFLEDLSLLVRKEEIKVNIKTSSPAKYQVVQVDDRKLIVDFENAILKTEKRKLSGDGNLVKEIFLEQVNANTVRLSLSLLKDEELFIFPAPDNPHLLQIRKVQAITGINWLNTKQGSRLVIESDGELTAKVEKLADANRIRIDLAYARVNPGLILPEISGDQGKTLQLETISPHQIRLEMDLHYFLSYRKEFSSDKRQLRIFLTPSPLVNKTFIIDPGHGGQDNGAMGKRGTLEKELNLEVSLRLKDLLEAAGAEVVLTRFDDVFISLYERAFLANFLMADFFISIHTNSHTKVKAEGIEVFYYPNPPHARLLAKNILDALARETGLKKLTVKTNNFAVIRETQMPGVLLELGFISNPQEELTLRTDDFKNNAAQGIFKGIIDYLK